MFNVLNTRNLKYFKPNNNGIVVSQLYVSDNKDLYTSNYNIISLGYIFFTGIINKIDLTGLKSFTGRLIGGTTTVAGVVELIIPKDMTILNPSNFFTYMLCLEKLTLEDGFKVSGLSLPNNFFSKENLIDILDKLADVTEDTENTYTFTFGEKNLAKLTSEEIAVGTAKGWTIN